MAYSKCFEKDLPRPVANIFLKKMTGDWHEFFPLIDTGAMVSFFNKSACVISGYELEKGKQCIAKSASGHAIPCFVHSVDMKIGEEVINANVAFSTSDVMGKSYLGRVDVFDNFQV